MSEEFVIGLRYQVTSRDYVAISFFLEAEILNNLGDFHILNVFRIS